MRAWVRDLMRTIRVRGHGPESMQAEPDAVAELALWAATADGVLDEAEVEELAGLLARLPGLSAFDAERARGIVAGLAAKYATEDAIAARILELTVRVRSQEARRSCYQLAIWSAARDGRFSEEEAAFLENLQEALELSDDEADALLHKTVETGS